MSLPLWDDIEVPPDWTLVDINGIEPESLRQELQGAALELWVDQAPASFEDPIDRPWDPSEGMFAVKDSGGNIVAIQLVIEVE